MDNVLRHVDALRPATSRLLLIDLQPRLLAAMPADSGIVAACVQLHRGAQLFAVPISVTEQNPDKLGSTIPDLLPVDDCIAKLRFSGAADLPWSNLQPADARFQVVIAGLEAHVCLLQTALDLLAHGFQVNVVADAVASRRPYDREIALQRLTAAGAVLTTAEAVLFEWCETADHAAFKAVSQLAKQRSVESDPNSEGLP